MGFRRNYVPVGLTVLFTAVFLPVMSHALEPVILNDSSGQYPVGLHMEYLEDKEGNWTFEDVSKGTLSGQFVKSYREVPNFGYTSSVYWFRFILTNAAAGSTEWLLEVGYPVLDRIDLYMENPAGHFIHKEAGDIFPFKKREIDHRNFLLPLKMNPGASTLIYARIQTESSVQLPLTVWSYATFIKQDQKKLLVLWIYNGIILIMILYNFFLFIFMRGKNHLLFILFAIFYSFLPNAINGLSYQYLWPGSPWWANISIPLSISVSYVFSAMFTIEFLNLKRNIPLGYKIMLISICLGFSDFIISIFFSYRFAIQSLIVTSLINCLLMMILSTLSLNRGFKAARFYLIAWQLFLLGIFVLGLNKAGLIPRNIFTENAHLIVSAVQMLLFSLALGDRFDIEKKEKFQAQEEALKNEQIARQAEAAALRVQKLAAENLQKEVDLKTIELRDKNVQLQEQNVELANAFQKLKEMQNQLVLREKMATLGKLVAGVTHEFNNHMGAVKGAADVSRRCIKKLGQLVRKNDNKTLTVDEQPYNETMNILDKSANNITTASGRITKIVDSLANFSRLDEADYQKTQIHEGIDSTLALIQHEIKDGVIIRKEYGEIPEIACYPNQLNQVFMILLINAVQAVDGHGTVTIKTCSRNESVCIHISDTGRGIPPERLNNLFDLAISTGETRMHFSTNLPNAYNIIQRHNGTMKVTSEVGKGTEFTISLPVNVKILHEK